MDFNQIFHLEASGLRSRRSTSFSGTDVSSDDDNCATSATAMSRKNNNHPSGKERYSESSSRKFLENSNNNTVDTNAAKQKTTSPAKHHSAHPNINDGSYSSGDDEDLQTNSYNLLKWSNRLELESNDLKDQTAFFLQKLEKLVERLESSNVNQNIVPPSPASTQPPQPQAVNGKTGFQANSNCCNADLRKDMQQIKKSLEDFHSAINENIANNTKHQNTVAPIHLPDQDNGPLVEKLNELQRKHSQNICKDIMNKSKDFHYKQRKKIRDEKIEFESKSCKRLDQLESNQQMILELSQSNKSNSNNDRNAHEPPSPPRTIKHTPSLPPSSCIQSSDSAAAHNSMPKNDNPKKRKNVAIGNRTTNSTTTTTNTVKRPRVTKANVSDEDSFTAYTLNNDLAGVDSRENITPATYADNVGDKKDESVTIVDKSTKQITPRSGIKFSRAIANCDFGKPYSSSVPPPSQTSSPQLSIYASNNTIANSYTSRDFPTTNDKEDNFSRGTNSSFTSSLQTLNTTNADDVNQKLVSPNEVDTQDYENTLLSIISDD